MAKKKLKLSELDYLKPFVDGNFGQLMSPESQSSKQALLAAIHYYS